MSKSEAEELTHWLSSWIGRYLTNTTAFGVGMYPSNAKFKHWIVEVMWTNNAGERRKVIFDDSNRAFWWQELSSIQAHDKKMTENRGK